MASISLSPPSGRYLSFSEREEIALLQAQQFGVRDIARQLERSPTTISRELRRNAATRGGTLQYRATVAQWKAERAAERPKVAKLAQNTRLRAYVQERLSGTVRDVQGKPIAGPKAPWNGRRHGRRADRRWGTSWSPEQISRLLLIDFPDDASMRVSMKPSTSRSTFKVVAHCDAACVLACALVAHCGYHAPEHGSEESSSSRPS